MIKVNINYLDTYLPTSQNSSAIWYEPQVGQDLVWLAGPSRPSKEQRLVIMSVMAGGGISSVIDMSIARCLGLGRDGLAGRTGQDSICAMEPLYRGHHWDPAGCPV